MGRVVKLHDKHRTAKTQGSIPMIPGPSPPKPTLMAVPDAMRRGKRQSQEEVET